MVASDHARRRFAERYPDTDFDEFLSLAPNAVVIALDGEMRTRDFRHVTVGLTSVWFVVERAPSAAGKRCAEGDRIVTVLTGTQAEGALYHKGVGWTLRPTPWTRAGGPQF